MRFSPIQMHIPDAFLSITVAVVCWIITASVLAVALRRINMSLNERRVPLMGIMAAFIFAAQMINFPVAAGTSGHLLGGALAAILLGPWAAMLVMTSVIAVQGLLFQDGGLLAMGANILNMGLITAAIGYGLYQPFQNRKHNLRLVVAGFAAWLSVMAGALFTSLQLWLSGTAKLALVVPTMLAVHALIGLGEAAITVTALAFIFRLRPDLAGGDETAKSGRGWIFVGLGIAIIVAVLSPLASVNPDGLNRVAIDLGFIQHSQPVKFEVIPNYNLPFLGQTPLSKILSGALGVLVVAGLFFLAARLLRRRTAKEPPREHDNVFDRYRPGESLIHHLDPRVKVLVTVGFILSNVLLPDAAWLAFLISWIFILIVSRFARLGFGYIFTRSFVALPFALAAITAIFSVPGNALTTWHIGATSLTVTDAGLLRFASIMLRSWLSVQGALLLVATTRFPDMIHALEHLHFPNLIVTIIAFLYRYLFVLTNEVLRLTRARQARSATATGFRSGGDAIWRARVTGNMVGQLFLRSYERSDRIYNAMLSRGYTGQIRTLSPHIMKRRDWLFAGLALTVFIFLQLIGRWLIG
jgi:cobalt/nickel transport system permease protein